MRVPSRTRHNPRFRRLSKEVVRGQRLASGGAQHLPRCSRMARGGGNHSFRPWGTKGEYNRVMQGQAKLTPIQVLERLQLRLEQRMECLQRVKLDGYHGVIS